MRQILKTNFYTIQSEKTNMEIMIEKGVHLLLVLKFVWPYLILGILLLYISRRDFA